MKQTDHQIHSTCMACSKEFRTTAEFDRHRTGQHGKDRHCMTTQEMQDEGWQLTTSNLWRSPHAITKYQSLAFATQLKGPNTHETSSP